MKRGKMSSKLFEKINIVKSSGEMKFQPHRASVCCVLRSLLTERASSQLAESLP
jgi:hypothetical protein